MNVPIFSEDTMHAVFVDIEEALKIYGELYEAAWAFLKAIDGHGLARPASEWFALKDALVAAGALLEETKSK